MITKRICIYPKDVMRITGRSERYGRSILQQIRTQLNKASHQFVTVEEFSQFTGIDKELVNQFID